MKSPEKYSVSEIPERVREQLSAQEVGRGFQLQIGKGHVSLPAPISKRIQSGGNPGTGFSGKTRANGRMNLLAGSRAFVQSWMQGEENVGCSGIAVVSRNSCSERFPANAHLFGLEVEPDLYRARFNADLPFSQRDFNLPPNCRVRVEAEYGMDLRIHGLYFEPFMAHNNYILEWPRKDKKVLSPWDVPVRFDSNKLVNVHGAGYDVSSVDDRLLDEKLIVEKVRDMVGVHLLLNKNLSAGVRSVHNLQEAIGHDGALVTVGPKVPLVLTPDYICKMVAESTRLALNGKEAFTSTVRKIP